MPKKVYSAFECNNPGCRYMDREESVIKAHEHKFENWNGLEGFIFSFIGNISTNYGLTLPKYCTNEYYPIIYIDNKMDILKFTGRMTFDEIKKLWKLREIDFLEDSYFESFVNGSGKEILEAYEGTGFFRYLQRIDGWTRSPIGWRHERRGNGKNKVTINGEGICHATYKKDL